MKHKGFTVVELLVIIVVIAILAGITMVSYSFVRDDAMDAKIRAATKTIGDAIVLYENNAGGRSGLAVGYLSNSGGVDDKVVPKYLSFDYRDGIHSKSVQDSDNVFRWHNCPDTSSSLVVYASLNSPSAEDTSNFNKIKASCGHTNVEAPESGSNKYNYARIF